MITKKDLVGNELVKEVITIRVDTLWRMLGLKREGRLPKIEEEGATGEFDNKGAIFIPGGLIYGDVDGDPVTYDSHGKMGAVEFREKIRNAMQYDNATLLYQDGIAAGIHLDSGFFSKAARQIFAYKKAAMKRIKKIEGKRPLEFSSGDITRSHCPSYINEPYGSRTRLSSCISVCLIELPMFYAYCKTALNFNAEEEEKFSKSLNAAQEPVAGKKNTILAPPYIIVCHDTRYQEHIFTGIIRILGFGKFGEFASFTLEEARKSVLREARLNKEEFSPAEIFAEDEGIKIVGVLRIYAPTTPGKRSQKTITKLISPSKDLGLDIEQIEREARERYLTQ
jgi:hypothetical protein